MLASPSYGPVDKTLHRLALGSRAVCETLFDVDQVLAKRRGPRPAAGSVGDRRLVFVAGLARAGTTIVLRRLHASGCFRSLTYRDMPFVIAPNLWRQLSRQNRANEQAPIERAHGDGLTIHSDSPESFDEVFWRVFDGASYIKADRIVPHAPDEALTGSYARYVAAILAAADADQRYLSKNNNNALRLPALAATFPNALIVVPYRHPMAHAASLWRQHQRFLDLQESDPFILTYMSWLGHHEFGAGHKPFVAHPDAALPPLTAEDIDYWLDLWIRFYRFVLDSAPATARFVCHEDLCADPRVWADLADAAGLPQDARDGEEFVDFGAAPAPQANTAIVRDAEALYQELCERARPR